MIKLIRLKCIYSQRTWAAQILTNQYRFDWNAIELSRINDLNQTDDEGSVSPV